MRAVFVMVKTDPGHVDEVALRIADLASFSEAYSTSGQYDLLCKFYVEEIDGIGRLVNSEIGRIAHVRETFTILTFNAFPAPGSAGQ